MKNMLQIARLIGGLIAVLTIGCSDVPLFSENRVNFPPWEKLPEQEGINYLQKRVVDAGIDPHYLALIEYGDDADLQLVLDTFMLVPLDGEPNSSFVDAIGAPSWFPLEGTTQTFCYRNGPGEEDFQYVSNLWVNPDENLMILERTWW